MAHKLCPHCYNYDKRTDVYRCRDCGCVFCAVCAAPKGILNVYCPECKGRAHRIGRVE